MNDTTSLDNFYIQYADPTTTTGEYYIEPYYPPCGGTTWVGWPGFCSERNKTEHAFEILKLMVKEKIISEPRSFKKFVELVEKIAKVV